MKKFLSGLLLGVILATAPSALAASRTIRLIVNGQDVASDVPPQNISGRVMIPARPLAEALGATVCWDAGLNAVVISSVENGQSNPTGDDWVALRSLSSPANFDSMTATTDVVTLVRGDITITITFRSDDRQQRLSTTDIIVQKSGVEIEALEGRNTEQGLFLPRDLLVRYGAIES